MRNEILIGVLVFFGCVSACRLACKAEVHANSGPDAAVCEECMYQEMLNQIEARMTGQIRRWGYSDLVFTRRHGYVCMNSKLGRVYGRPFNARNTFTGEPVSGEICCADATRCEVLWMHR